MKAIIIEDSRLARVELKNMLKTHAEVELLGEAPNATLAKELIESQQPDLIFLDINLPGQNGFDLLESLDEVPLVIFTTAYDEYAIKAFEYNTLDYLLKPIEGQRLAAALAKVEKQLARQSKEEELSNQDLLSLSSRIFVKDNEDCWLVELADIRRFETEGNYTRIYFENQKPLIHKSLAKIEERLHPKQFFRANRQEIINLKYIKDITPWFSGNLKLTMTDGAEVEISRRQASKFKKLLSL